MNDNIAHGIGCLLMGLGIAAIILAVAAGYWLAVIR
jgi:hypothetical protein